MSLEGEEAQGKMSERRREIVIGKLLRKRSVTRLFWRDERRLWQQIR
jgi:hypothetical protein